MDLNSSDCGWGHTGGLSITENFVLFNNNGPGATLGTNDVVPLAIEAMNDHAVRVVVWGGTSIELDALTNLVGRHVYVCV